MHISHRTNVFHGVVIPEGSTVVGYAAIIYAYQLEVPMIRPFSVVSDKNRTKAHKDFHEYPSRYLPEDNLYKQLIFALKYEGVRLLDLKKLFEKISNQEMEQLVTLEPMGQYSRQLWYLYEWLMDQRLNLADASVRLNYTNLTNPRLQFTSSEGEKSKRHRIINNLLGSRNFCPFVRKKQSDLVSYIDIGLEQKKDQYLVRYGKSLLQRTSAFLMLKDSKASFTIEGESPKSKRMSLWGKAIGQAGSNDLNKIELERLQDLVIENKKHISMGYRKQEGFIGEHDEDTFQPVPDHISARWKDLDILMNGLIETNQKLIDDDIDPIVAAAIVAFGFVFIHPFVDGNGRIHRYLIHHMLAKKGFSHQGLVFPISAAILNRINDYRQVLEQYSHPVLEIIDWETDDNNNVKVLNETIDYYRYFDVTAQAVFLYECVIETIENIIPEEIEHLKKYDEFRTKVEGRVGLADNRISLLSKLLMQTNGKLSNQKKEKHFASLSQEEIDKIEKYFRDIYL